MKKVSFKIAKAIKEAGYPQGNTDSVYLTQDHNTFFKKDQIVNDSNHEWRVLTKHIADAPTYIEVWLWLWREKDLIIEHITDGTVYINIPNDKAVQLEEGYFDPEEAIIAAIEYLVINNLIK